MMLLKFHRHAAVVTTLQYLFCSLYSSLGLLHKLHTYTLLKDDLLLNLYLNIFGIVNRSIILSLYMSL